MSTDDGDVGTGKDAVVVVVEAVALPPGSLLTDIPFRDHVDAYCARIDATRFPDVDTLARVFLSSSPRWISAAMRARDSIVGIFGLKKSNDAPSTVQKNTKPFAVGDRAGIFRVFDRNDSEIILGEDDKHLDFRVSLLYERDERDASIARATISTIVRFNNALGRAYFVPVRPAHKRIVPAMMRHALL